ncbi:MAG TPA: uroporphyrinogen decarboxylase family protein [Opitutaceae bacterium]|nr:uroporphyrinogen decarboxylase family protein [Opitutaceae bacterium]
MTIRERILCALTWSDPDRVPLTIYDGLLPRGRAERQLREAGVGLITRLPAHQVEHRRVEITTREYFEGGRKLTRRTIHTPKGDVWQTLQPDPAYASIWICEHFIKRPEDYAVMETYLRDGVYHDNYGAIREAKRRTGDDGLVLVRVGKTPLQEMLYQLMGYERFAVDFSEHRELFDGLHSAMVERCQELYELAANAPVEILQLADNITADAIGPKRFQTYLMPEYAKLKARLAGTGKLLAVHMDGRLRGLTDQIAAAACDIIEGLTPPPMGNISVRDARLAWPGKALWLNFTSSVHLEPPEAIAAHTRQLVGEAGSKRGFAISVTEDAPFEALERSLAAIARVLEEMA